MILIEQCQRWYEHTRYIIANRHSTVQLEMFDEVQNFGGKAWIYALWTDDKFRRKGFATEVLRRAEKVAKKCGHSEVYLDWKAQDTPRGVLMWYIECGYTVRRNLDGGTHILLSKRLGNERAS